MACTSRSDSILAQGGHHRWNDTSTESLNMRRWTSSASGRPSIPVWGLFALQPVILMLTVGGQAPSAYALDPSTVVSSPTGAITIGNGPYSDAYHTGVSCLNQSPMWCMSVGFTSSVVHDDDARVKPGRARGTGKYD